MTYLTTFIKCRHQLAITSMTFVSCLFDVHKLEQQAISADPQVRKLIKFDKNLTNCFNTIDTKHGSKGGNDGLENGSN
jgi:hypothetical protein